MLTEKDLKRLMEAGLVYRHDQERWQGLQGLPATLYPSPRREIKVGGERYVEELIQPTLEPMRLTAREVGQLHSLARIWEGLIAVQREAIKRGLAGDDQFRPIVDAVVPPAMRPIALHDSGYESPKGPFIRLDMVRTPEGFRVVDINSTRPAGVGDQIILNAAHAANGEKGLFPIQDLFCTVVRDCFERWRSNASLHGDFTCDFPEPVQIAVVTEQSAGDWHNFRILTEALQREEWVKSAVILEEVPAPDDPRFNCVLRSRIKFGYPQFDRLLALPTYRFCVMSPLGRRWIGNKHWFVFLREEPMLSLIRERLGDADTDLLLAAIPETGVFTESGFVRFSDRTMDVQAMNRKEWIIKPGAGSSGKGIVFGRSAQKWQWDEFCSKPAICGALLQRYYRIKEPVTVLGSDGQPTTVNYYTKYGAFLFGGRLAGMEVMARATALVHGSRDTYFTTVVQSE